ncbi:hypothetical protein GEMRC1_004157 [Eukaryota sp. GEM-RC1]
MDNLSHFIQPFENFRLDCQLDEGSFGIIHHGHDLTSGQDVVLKELRHLSIYSSSSDRKLREITILSQMCHPNVLQLISFSVGPPPFHNIFLCFDLYDYDLAHLIKYIFSNTQSTLSHDTVLFLLSSIASGLSYLHSQDVLYRDLKPSNIFISHKKQSIVIGDLGSSKILDPPNPNTPSLVTLNYRAPEILFGDVFYSSPIDIFSLGCIWVELVTGKILFDSDFELGVLGQMVDYLGTFDEVDWPESKDLPGAKGLSFSKSDGVLEEILEGKVSVSELNLIRSMLSWDPKKRPTAEQILNLLPKFDMEKVELPEIPRCVIDMLFSSHCTARERECDSRV